MQTMHCYLVEMMENKSIMKVSSNNNEDKTYCAEIIDPPRSFFASAL